MSTPDAQTVPELPAKPQNPVNKRDADPPGEQRPFWALYAVAAALLVAFIVFSGILIAIADNIGITETRWARYASIVAPIEVLVFTAVGWLFGREVSRGAVTAAEKATANAQKDAQAARSGEESARAEVMQERQAAAAATTTAAEALIAQSDAANVAVAEQAEATAEAVAAGRELAGAVRVLTATGSLPGIAGGGIEGGATHADPRVEELRALADRLFPPA